MTPPFHTPLGGLPPGFLKAPSDAFRPETFSVIQFSPDQVVEKELSSVSELDPIEARGGVIWININGLGNVELLEELGQRLKLHPLALEDALTPHERPKLDDYPEHLFTAVQIFRWNSQTALEAERISAFLRPPYVLTVQERPGDCLDNLRERIRRGTGQIRRRGAGYLFYTILDAVVDHYFPILEKIGDWLADVEDSVVDRPQRRTVTQIQAVRRTLLSLRRSVWPLRESLNALIRDGSAFLQEDIRLYLRDCSDHAVQVLEVTETYREIASGLMDVYLSSLSTRLNEIMKVLTIISTIFIPLTFIVGVYGMNFEYMPELHWRFAYPVVWMVMLFIAGAMVWLFYRTGWLGSREE